jgi:down-regulator of transcription 1
MVKLATELLPEGLVLGRDTHDLIVSCAVEFVQLLTFQANEICQKETNNGYISLQHVIRACEELGFDEFVSEIESVSAAYEQELRTLQKVLSYLIYTD